MSDALHLQSGWCRAVKERSRNGFHAPLAVSKHKVPLITAQCASPPINPESKRWDLNLDGVPRRFLYSDLVQKHSLKLLLKGHEILCIYYSCYKVLLKRTTLHKTQRLGVSIWRRRLASSQDQKYTFHVDCLQKANWRMSFLWLPTWWKRCREGLRPTKV